MMAKARSYHIPAPPQIIAEAERRLREATAARERAQAQHREAHRKYQALRPGEPASITAATVDALAELIQPAIDAEREAERALKLARGEWKRSAMEALKGPVADFERELVETIRGLEALIAEGAEAAAKARKAGVSLPSRVPEACALARRAIVPLVRDILRQGGANV